MMDEFFFYSFIAFTQSLVCKSSQELSPKNIMIFIGVLPYKLEKLVNSIKFMYDLKVLEIPRLSFYYKQYFFTKNESSMIAH